MNDLKNISDKLEAYSREIHGESSTSLMTIDSLIDSHRRIREMQKKFISDNNKNWNEARERGYAFGVEQAKGEFISVHLLSKMTLLEIAQFINKHKELSKE